MRERMLLRKVNCTIVIFMLCLIVFILDFFVLLKHDTVIFSVSHLIQGNQWGILTEYGRLSGAAIYEGQWWRIITSIFLHAGIPHLAVNMLALLTVGFIVEEKIGSKKYALVFMGTGIFSALCTMTHTHGAVGASGAIYGVIGVFMSMLIGESSYIRGKMTLIKWIILVLYLTLPNLSGPVTAVAHFSGLLFGFILGLFMHGFFRTPAIHSEK
ncbi:MAG: rhomboid family intramembrane serine protease [Bacillota bacterium]|nr:rhomboid family intramembrane serine protease [Bacillota bacterium]